MLDIGHILHLTNTYTHIAEVITRMSKSYHLYNSAHINAWTN